MQWHAKHIGRAGVGLRSNLVVVLRGGDHEAVYDAGDPNAPDSGMRAENR